MKASAFAYARATSVANALELLTAHGDKARVLSGGQSLLPAMNLRLVSPELIIDIGELAELRGVAVKEGVLTIGALTRHVDLLKSPEIAAHAPLLTEAVAHVAHPAIRNRGTIGGSLAQADPASELPACMLTLGAILIARGPSGERRIPATEFFTGIYETALGPQELLVAVELPVSPGSSRISFMSSPADMVTTRSLVSQHRLSSRRGSSRIFALVSLRSAIAHCWPALPANWSMLPLRLSCYPRRLPRWIRNSILWRITRRRQPCAGIWRRSCWRAAYPRCLIALISARGHRRDDCNCDFAACQWRAY